MTRPEQLGCLFLLLIGSANIAWHLGMIPPAYAQHRPGGGYHHDGGGWHRPGGGYHHGPGWYNPGAAIGGAIIGGAITRWLFPEPAPVIVAPSGPSIEWCIQRYRSYNPETRTYLGYDMQYHACP